MTTPTAGIYMSLERAYFIYFEYSYNTWYYMIIIWVYGPEPRLSHIIQPTEFGAYTSTSL